MVRFDGYYDGSPKGKPKIGKLVIRAVADGATEMAELLSGHADWIWDHNPDQFDQVGRMPNLQALRAESMRINFLQIDAAGRSGAGNPLTNVKVRQAILHAIDRQAFAKQLVQGDSRPLDAPCYPSQTGCDQTAAVKYDYDPAKAKRLLAEAGYPNGFETELVGYLLDSWMASIQGYLGAVGIKAKVSRLQVGAVSQRNQKGDTPLTAASWGSNLINDVAAVFPVYYDGESLFDFARDPEAAKLVEEGGASRERAARVEPAARRRGGGIRRGLAEPDFGHAEAGLGGQHRGQQRLRVGMTRRPEQGLDRPVLDDTAEIHDRDLGCDMLDHCQIVA